jgi:exodeoxyribonuclease V alpha subunit
MSRSSREIKARFQRESRVFESDDLESRVVIADAQLIERDQAGKESFTDRITIKGEAAAGALVFGLEYRFFGRWFTHHLYGEQFHYESFVVDRPASREAVVNYLRQCKGFGSVRAGKLFDLHGEGSIDVVIADPEGVCNDVKGISYEDAHAASVLLRKSEHIRKAKLELIGLLHGKQFPRKLIDKLITDHGSEAAEIVRRNPFGLMAYNGCGFMKTDKLYLELGNDPARLKRQALCAWHAIAKVSDGDTWFPFAQAVRAIRDNVSGTNARVDRAIELAVRADLLRVRVEGMGNRWIAESKKADQELRVSRLINEAMDEPGIWPAFPAGDVGLSDHQRTALRIALQGHVCVLAGSPGTGKTHCTAALIKLVLDFFSADLIAACAPTGKAAVRMTEAMSKAGLPLKAQTIHSLLEIQSSEDGWSFLHGEHKPLPHKFIFADESSMVDVGLMGSLLAARGRGCHVLFVGDINQLSPVGHGAPLRDMIAAGVPTGTLTEIRRNSGRIVQACAEIRDTRKFTASKVIDLEAGENLGLIHRTTPDEQIDTLQATIDRFAKSGKYDPIWAVQVVCAVNKPSSPLNRKALNRKLQDQLNPHGASVAGNPFRVGDKVINLKNGWYKPLTLPREGVVTNKKNEVYVANGEQGECLSCDVSRFVVRLQNPDREVIVMRSNKSADDDQEARDPNSDTDDESTGTGCNWDLGYAISVHKSQGSEWPVVIVMLDDSGAAKMVCSRNWLYTAISRAKVLGLLIGMDTTAGEFCRRDGLRRKTFLTELIREGRAVEEVASDVVEWSDAAYSEILEGVLS